MKTYIEAGDLEILKASAEGIVFRAMSNESLKDANDIIDAQRQQRRQYGIYEANRQGVSCEEIAQYLDSTVEYVEDCVKAVELLEYSARTGNAIMFKIPQE